MNRILGAMWRRIPVLGLWLVLAIFALLPLRASADDEMGLDIGSGRGRSHEGDPLDTNDASGDPARDDEIQRTSSDWEQSFFDSSIWSLRVLVVPQFHGNTVTFQILFVADGARAPEGANAK